MGGLIGYRGPAGPRVKPVLTPRQLAIGKLYCAGAKMSEIADEFGITEGTAKTMFYHMRKRVGAASRLEFAKFWAAAYGAGEMASPVGALLADDVVRMGVYE